MRKSDGLQNNYLVADSLPDDHDDQNEDVPISDA